MILRVPNTLCPLISTSSPWHLTKVVSTEMLLDLLPIPNSVYCSNVSTVFSAQWWKVNGIQLSKWHLSLIQICRVKVVLHVYTQNGKEPHLNLEQMLLQIQISSKLADWLSNTWVHIKCSLTWAISYSTAGLNQLLISDYLYTVNPQFFISLNPIIIWIARYFTDRLS